ncbi:MAG: DUF4926 domain-containing protein [Armatimonadetes bacterium]|nr:DUF4926 domain-containing protein [Armatimonadota bacterium]NDK15904.1 DUF4926 domain-containing protein [Armatimonadota bacterium]PIX36690.1 MAG: DUF4926 domain-containing protein [Armatimonadetes bacterium CG_4_8_14_3_um_filter_66_20]PJB60199.1 MAG: DUF4926 domain-containing protein [Armatimonadetes bacterium CG_4_9_14_3_um_filter_66_14]
MDKSFRILDVVALVENLPERKLWRGQVGTIIEDLAPGVHEVEFCDNAGRTYASLALPATRLMLLHHEPVEERYAAVA